MKNPPLAFLGDMLTGFCPPQYFSLKSVDGQLKPVKVEPQRKNYNKPKMKTLHLATAVLATIADFRKSQRDFSAYDVTQALRDQVRNGTLDIADARKDYIGQAYVPVIVHNQIRAIVAEFSDLEYLQDYTPTTFTDQSRNLSYRLYKYGPVSQTPTVPVPAAQAAQFSVTGVLPSAVPTPTSTVTAKRSIKATAGLKKPDGAMWQKVSAYINARNAAGNVATLKQVQSRLKGYAITCSDLNGQLRNRGYQVVSARNVSQATVS